MHKEEDDNGVSDHMQTSMIDGSLDELESVSVVSADKSAPFKIALMDVCPQSRRSQS